MLNDMPKSRSTALVADPDDAIGAVAGRRAGRSAAKTLRGARAPRVKIVKQVGNYGEAFERNLGMGSPLKIDRGMNRLWKEGGLQYAPPIR